MRERMAEEGYAALSKFRARQGADFAALKAERRSSANGVTAMLNWMVLTGVIGIVVAMYFLERG